VDADALLETGQVPIQPILEGAGTLGEADELRVLVSFRPVPIVERLEAQGFACEFGTQGDGAARGPPVLQ
jgi:hypothetical protein